MKRKINQHECVLVEGLVWMSLSSQTTVPFSARLYSHVIIWCSTTHCNNLQYTEVNDGLQGLQHKTLLPPIYWCMGLCKWAPRQPCTSLSSIGSELGEPSLQIRQKWKQSMKLKFSKVKWSVQWSPAVWSECPVSSRCSVLPLPPPVLPAPPSPAPLTTNHASPSLVLRL